MAHREMLPAILLAASFLLVAAQPAYAVDGEVLIDQAKASAGNVTPGDTPGFPVTISRRGKYKLSGNLEVTSGIRGIDVEQHDVTIDLNGYAVRSVPPGRVDTAIDGRSKRGLTVMNGTIASFSNRGISNAFGPHAVVENMRILFNGGGGVFLGDGSTVRGSTMSGNGLSNINCQSGCLIEQNVLTGSTIGGGVFLRGDGLVLGNVIAANKSFGIRADGPVGFGNNTLVGNNSGGAQIFGTIGVPAHPNACTPACP